MRLLIAAVLMLGIVGCNATSLPMIQSGMDDTEAQRALDNTFPTPVLCDVTATPNNYLIRTYRQNRGGIMVYITVTEHNGTVESIIYRAM